MSGGLDVAVLAAGSSSLDLTSRRLLPLAAGALLILLVFQQLRRVEPVDEGRYSWSRRLAAGTVGVGFPVLLLGLGAVIFSVQYPLLLRNSQAAGFGSNASSTRSSTQSAHST